MFSCRWKCKICFMRFHVVHVRAYVLRNMYVHDGLHLRHSTKLNFDFLLSQDGLKFGFMIANSQCPPFAKFCKNKFDFFLSVKQDEKQCCVLLAHSRKPLFAKFCKNKFRLFPKRRARRKIVLCHVGTFAKTTIREILQKQISTFI